MSDSFRCSIQRKTMGRPRKDEHTNNRTHSRTMFNWIAAHNQMEGRSDGAAPLSWSSMSTDLSSLYPQLVNNHHRSASMNDLSRMVNPQPTTAFPSALNAISNPLTNSLASFQSSNNLLSQYPGLLLAAMAQQSNLGSTSSALSSGSSSTLGGHSSMSGSSAMGTPVSTQPANPSVSQSNVFNFDLAQRIQQQIQQQQQVQQLLQLQQLAAAASVSQAQVNPIPSYQQPHTSRTTMPTAAPTSIPVMRPSYPMTSLSSSAPSSSSSTSTSMPPPKMPPPRITQRPVARKVPYQQAASSSSLQFSQRLSTPQPSTSGLNLMDHSAAGAIKKRQNASTDSSSGRSSSPFEMGKIPTENYIPSHFMKGTVIQLASGKHKRVEEMNTDDFIISAQFAAYLTMESSTVRKIDMTGPIAKISFNIGVAKQPVVEMEFQPEHPFFVVGHGWSSCDPIKTKNVYGLPSSQLHVGDVCISLTKKPEDVAATEALDKAVPISEARKHADKDAALKAVKESAKKVNRKRKATVSIDRPESGRKSAPLPFKRRATKRKRRNSHSL